MFTTIICTVSPLHQERYGMDLALTLAEAGIPVSFYPMPILGATGPITIAGSAVVNNAEFLSGATLVQLAHPGAPVMHGGGPTAMYMNSGAYASNSPEAMLIRACQGHMADFYGVPAWYGAGATTAKEPGIQSAYENALAMFMAYSNGADVTFGTGLLDGSRILCLENMVVDDEIIGMVKRILTGIEVSEETLAVDLIKKMGFNGNYLFDNHTRAHVRELWQAKLGETGNYDGWKNAGPKSTTEKAQEKVAEILARRPPSSRRRRPSGRASPQRLADCARGAALTTSAHERRGQRPGLPARDARRTSSTPACATRRSTASRSIKETGRPSLIKMAEAMAAQKSSGGRCSTTIIAP